MTTEQPAQLTCTKASTPLGERKCEVALPGPLYWVLFCDQPATAVHRYACVHEHVRERATCDEHAPEPGKVGCRTCFEGSPSWAPNSWGTGAPHECPMTAELLEAGRHVGVRPGNRQRNARQEGQE